MSQAARYLLNAPPELWVVFTPTQAVIVVHSLGKKSLGSPSSSPPSPTEGFFVGQESFWVSLCTVHAYQQQTGGFEIFPPIPFVYAEM